MSNELVKYGTYSKEAAQQEAREMGQKDFFKAEEGKNRVRYLPGPVGSKSPFRLFREHRLKVPGRQYDLRFQCPGTGCPLCAQSSQLNKTGNPADRQHAYELSAKPKAIGALISRREPERGPLIHEFGKKIHGALSLLLDEDVGGNFTDPREGFDIIIMRKGTGFDTQYEVFRAKTSSPLAESVEQMNEWLGKLPDLEQTVPPMKSIGEVRQMMQGGPADDDDEPAPRQATGKKPRRADDDVIDSTAEVDDLDA